MRTPRPWGMAPLVAAALLATPATAQRRPPATPDAPQPASLREVTPREGRQTLLLESGNGRVLALTGAAANVFVADPRVAEVRPASTNSLFVFGVGPGRTTIAAMDAEGRPVAQYDVTVRASTFAAGEAEAAAVRLLQNTSIRVTPQARGMLVTGRVNSPAEAARTVAILKGFLGENQVVENQLAVQSAIQVNMRVRVVEMSRSVSRGLGIDWQAMGSIGRIAANFNTVTGLGALGSAATGIARIGSRDINAVIDALTQDNLVRILAEPNLTVMSGQAGSFLAGGEYPVPVAQKDNVITVEFKKYGISLNVVPTVMTDQRINLHIAPEVSQLSDNGAVRLSSGSSTSGSTTLSIPAITVRRAETSVELGSGQSFAIAGLLSDNTTQSTNGVTLLGDLPIIGPLFRSSAFQRQETELVIIVTPYIVRAVDDPARLHTPDEKYRFPTDFERIAQLRQVGTAPEAPRGARIPGAAGFIVQ